MKTFQITQTGKVNNAVCTYHVLAENEEEAIEKLKKGDVSDSDIIDGDFEPDDREEFEIEESNNG